jgi:hypothetical protein
MKAAPRRAERAAAAAKASELVRSLGLTWRDIIAPPIAPEQPQMRSAKTDWQSMAWFCQARSAQLSLRDRDFIRSMTKLRGAPSAKQRSWLVGLYFQCRDAD